MHLSQQELALLFKGYDAILNYMDSLAPEKFEAFAELYTDTMNAVETLKECESVTRRAHLESCFSKGM